MSSPEATEDLLVTEPDLDGSAGGVSACTALRLSLSIMKDGVSEARIAVADFSRLANA